MIGAIIEDVIPNQNQINKANRHKKFENYLKNNPESLNDYIKLKENSRGLSIQQYYRKKVELINEILGK